MTKETEDVRTPFLVRTMGRGKEVYECTYSTRLQLRTRPYSILADLQAEAPVFLLCLLCRASASVVVLAFLFQDRLNPNFPQSLHLGSQTCDGVNLGCVSGFKEIVRLSFRCHDMGRSKDAHPIYRPSYFPLGFNTLINFNSIHSESTWLRYFGYATVYSDR